MNQLHKVQPERADPPKSQNYSESTIGLTFKTTGIKSYYFAESEPICSSFCAISIIPHTCRNSANFLSKNEMQVEVESRPPHVTDSFAYRRQCMFTFCMEA